MPAAGPQNTRKAQIKRKRVVKVKAGPTNTAQSYVSQGKAVERVANHQKRVKAKRKATAPARQFVSQGRAVEKVANKKKTAHVPREVQKRVFARNMKAMTNRSSEERMTQLAPVLKVLDQTTRPLHAVAGAAKHDVQQYKKHGVTGLVGHGSLKAASRGIQNKDKSTFSDVLKEAGIKNKTVRGVAGFVGDVALDPTTYLTGGSTSVARQAGTKAAEKATKKALAKGLTHEQATRFGERAARQAVRKAPEGKVVTVKAGSLKGSVRVRGGKPVRKVIPDRAKDVVADVNPNAVPRGVSKETSDRAVNATRTARGKINTAERDAVATAHGIRKHIGEENYNRVVDAIEAGKVSKLPDDLARHAHRLRSESKGVRRAQRRAGIKVGEIKHRRIVVPKVTADVEGAQKALRAAQVERGRVERAHRGQIHKAGVAEGKARVLVGQSDRKAERAGRASNGSKPVRTLSRLESERGKLHAMDKGDVVSKARQAVRDAEAHLETTKAAARNQRGAAVRATNRKAAQAQQPKGYVYRQLTNDAAEAEAKKVGRAGSGTKHASSKARTEKRLLSVVRAESPGRYREDLHALSAERHAGGHTAAAKAQLNRDLAELGRPVKRGSNPDLKEGEAVFHVKGSEITEVTDKKVIDRIARPLRPSKDGSKLKGANKQGGRYVILNREIVDRAKEGAVPTLKGPGVLHVFDKVTGGFKRVALATPGFHVRNLVGDTAQAYVAQPGHKLPGNLRRSGKVLKALGEKDAAKRELRPVNKSGHTLKTGKYGHVPLEQVADRLVQHGAARSGYTARELTELAASGGKKAPGKLRRGMKRVGDTRPAAATKRAFLNREDLPRIATAVHALQNGASWEEAARKVADTHFDYAHLTGFERNVARRLLPFYTWSARNIPFTARNVVQRPGKYANFQKVREEAAKATGMDQQDPKTRKLYADLKRAGVKLPKGWEQGLTEWEQRNAGVPVSWKGQKFTVSLGLPLQDLSEFPGAAGKGQAAEYYQKGMSLLNPVIKDPVEYFENHSFFFRDELQRSYSPNVAAPGWVGKLPAAAQKNLQVVKIQDKKSGKMVWGWPAKMDYLAKAVPGTPNYVQQLSTPGTDRRGKSAGGKALAFAGVKSVPYDPVKNAVNLAYARQQEIQEKLAGLRQQGIGLTKGKRPSAEYRKLNDQLKIVTQIAFQGKSAQGYKVLPKQGGPKRVRATGGAKSGWSDSGSQGSWGDQSSQGTWGG